MSCTKLGEVGTSYVGIVSVNVIGQFSSIQFSANPECFVKEVTT